MVHVRIPAQIRDFNFSKTYRLLFYVNVELFGPRKSGRVVRLIVYLHLGPTLRMSGVIPLLPLYAFMACTETKLYLPLALFLSPHYVTFTLFLTLFCYFPSSCRLSQISSFISSVVYLYSIFILLHSIPFSLSHAFQFLECHTFV
jgi:hypothetical protein